MTEKQEMFIRNLMRDRETGNLYNSLEAQTIRAGLGHNLSTRQASEFIEALLECPKKSFVEEVVERQPKASKTLAKRLRAFAEENKDCLPAELVSETRLICGITKEAFAERMAVLQNAVEGK